MSTFVWLAVLVAAIYALHRLFLWMEDRGWIYYRKKRGSSGALGSAFLDVQSLFEPGTRHVLEERRKEDVQDKESGDPPGPVVRDVNSENDEENGRPTA